MIRNEYLRFMQTLVANDANENTRKLANIILDHLEEIIPLGTASGRRVKKIVELAQREFTTASVEFTVAVDDIQTNTNNMIGLKSLTVGPFRGFAKSELFDLDSQMVLIYGPNGTGKSSFCEALEYGLLGSVEEAESKRFRVTNDYLKNAHVDQFELPKIGVNLADAESAFITANESQFRFCFVEKNRIDNFSRIAAHLPARQTELISTLFGLDSFNNFVQGFSNEIIDVKHIDLTGLNASQLAKKQLTLEGHRQTIKSNAEALDRLLSEEQTLAEKYQKNIPFADFVVMLGTEENPGEIQKLEAELQQSPAALSGLKYADLLQARINVEKAITDLKSKENELAKYSEGLSYKQLYQAVIVLNAISPESCPACKTPIDQATENPFQIAEAGLAKLEHLSALEQQRDELKITQHQAIKSVYEALKKCCLSIEDEPNLLKGNLVVHDSMLDVAWWHKLFQLGEQDMSAWMILEQQIKQLEAADTITSELQAARQQKIDRLTNLRQLHDQVIEVQTKRKTIDEGSKAANVAITAFDDDNKDLIASVKHEKETVAQNQLISSAYSELVRQLNNYNDTLPTKLVADLGSLVVELYNAFNRTDALKDLLANLILPATSGERIQISFQSAPEKYFDALHVLSEGHIRCIGLAILLAKNLKENCPVLIFDDPVNAIDHDHREAIRRTLFEDDYFKNKQIILTCHDGEFFKDIQTLLSVEKAKAAYCYTFKPQSEDNHIVVDFDTKPRNYVLLAIQYFDDLNYRDALMSSRRALENLSNEVWRYYAKNGGGSISICKRDPNAPIELRTLTAKLYSEIKKDKFVSPLKDPLMIALKNLLGSDAESREWRYLNKGTHEESERADFNRSTVKLIVDSLVTLDAVLHK